MICWQARFVGKSSICLNSLLLLRFPLELILFLQEICDSGSISGHFALLLTLDSWFFLLYRLYYSCSLCWTLIEGSEHFCREFLLHTQTLFQHCHQKMEIAWRGMSVMLIRPVSLSLMQGIFEWGWLWEGHWWWEHCLPWWITGAPREMPGRRGWALSNKFSVSLVFLVRLLVNCMKTRIGWRVCGQVGGSRVQSGSDVLAALELKADPLLDSLLFGWLVAASKEYWGWAGTVLMQACPFSVSKRLFPLSALSL